MKNITQTSSGNKLSLPQFKYLVSGLLVSNIRFLTVILFFSLLGSLEGYSLFNDLLITYLKPYVCLYRKQLEGMCYYCGAPHYSELARISASFLLFLLFYWGIKATLIYMTVSSHVPLLSNYSSYPPLDNWPFVIISIFFWDLSQLSWRI